MNEFDKRLGDIISGLGYKTNSVQKSKILNSKEPLVLFGAGAAGTACYDKLMDWNYRGEIVFCDNFKSGLKKGVEIISYERLIKDPHYSRALVIIAIGGKLSPEVYAQLHESGVSEDRIIYRDYVDDKVPKSYISNNVGNLRTFYYMLHDNLSREVFWKKIENALYCRIDMSSVFEPDAEQYFDPCLVLNNNEVFVDCGSFIGDTAMKFIERTYNSYEHIFAFEPEQENYITIKSNLSQYERINVINKGVWEQDDVLKFNSGGGAASGISDIGKTEIPVTYIDSLLNTGHIPSFIKMDIEGSEIKALKGASETIRLYKPKLAICVYHRPEDIIEIPMLLRELNADYSYYLRQYVPGFTWAETVLYAV